MKVYLLIYRLITILGLGLASGMLAAASLSISEVADGVFVHQGQHVGIEDKGREDIANIGFITGDDCIAVIDTGGSIMIGEQLLAEIRQRSELPVCYVINTHVHFDHVLGNAAFRSDGTSFIGHKNLPEALANNIDFFLEEFKTELGDHADASLIVKPDATVEDVFEINLGNRLLTIRAHQPAHTRTDLTVYDNQTGTLWMSDLLFVERIPVIDASLKGWLEVMQEYQGVDARVVIPGHGPTNLTLKDAMQPQQLYLETLLQETRQMIEKGAFMEEVLNEVGKQEKLKWQLYAQQHKRNVSNAFIELEWE